MVELEVVAMFEERFGSIDVEGVIFVVRGFEHILIVVDLVVV